MVVDFNSILFVFFTEEQNCVWQNDTATGRKSCHVPILPPLSSAFQMAVTHPNANQGVLVFPNHCAFTTISDPVLFNNGYCQATGTDASGVYVSNAGGIFEHNLTVVLTFDNFVLPSYIIPANVVSVKAISFNASGYSNLQVAPTGASCNGSGNWVSSPDYAQQTTPALTVTGATFSTLSCSIQSVQSVLGTYMNESIPLIGVWVEYTGTPPPASTNILVQQPLLFANNTLSLQSNYPQILNPYTVALPPANLFPAAVIPVLNAANSTSCVPGGG